jgi:hypothetical protein
VDRPAVCFYEIGGFKVDTQDPDPYNVYNAPDWAPLLQLAGQHTDIIRLMSPVRARSVDPTGFASASVQHDFFKEDSWEEGNWRITKNRVTVAGRTMTQTTKRERDLDTIWTTEHLLKDTDDLKAYLKIPDEVFAEAIDVSPLEAEESELGDRGIVMVDTEDPLWRLVPTGTTRRSAAHCSVYRNRATSTSIGTTDHGTTSRTRSRVGSIFCTASR